MVSVRPSHSEGSTNRGVSLRAAVPLHPGRGRAAARVSIEVRPVGGRCLRISQRSVSRPAPKGGHSGSWGRCGASCCCSLTRPKADNKSALTCVSSLLPKYKVNDSNPASSRPATYALSAAERVIRTGTTRFRGSLQLASLRSLRGVWVGMDTADGPSAAGIDCKMFLPKCGELPGEVGRGSSQEAAEIKAEVEGSGGAREDLLIM